MLYEAALDPVGHQDSEIISGLDLETCLGVLTLVLHPRERASVTPALRCTRWNTPYAATAAARSRHALVEAKLGTSS